MKSENRNTEHGARNTERKRGVTLIEMATVVAIVLILGVLMIVEFNSMDDKARRSTSLVNAKAVGDALRMYKQEKRKYTCALNDIMPYTNLTTLRSSFLTVMLQTDPTDNCVFGINFTYIRLTAFVKGIVPNYIVNYQIWPAKDPECSVDGASVYFCKDKW